MPRPQRPFRSIRGLLIAVVVISLGLWGSIERYKAQKREQQLIEELKAERVRAQGYQRLAQLAIIQGSPNVQLRVELDQETERFQAEAVRRRLKTREISR